MEKGPFSFFDTSEINRMLLDAGFTNITTDTVKKVATVPNIDYVVEGFATGSPLAAYLSQKSEAIRGEVLQRLRGAVTGKFGEKDLQLPMQAIICRAEKA
jgi:hypothetical protein